MNELIRKGKKKKKKKENLGMNYMKNKYKRKFSEMISGLNRKITFF